MKMRNKIWVITSKYLEAMNLGGIEYVQWQNHGFKCLRYPCTRIYTLTRWNSEPFWDPDE